MLIRMLIAAALMVVGPTILADSTSAGGAIRYYQIATPELVVTNSGPPYHNNVAAFSFAIDAPGNIAAIHIVPTQEIGASLEDRIVGSVWVNGSAGPTIDDLFCICDDKPAMVLSRLADVGMPQTSDMPVHPGDVVTVLLGDEQSGAPPLPAATWVLEVAQ